MVILERCLRRATPTLLVLLINDSMGVRLIGFTHRRSSNPPKKGRQKAKSLARLGLPARDARVRE